MDAGSTILDAVAAALVVARSGDAPAAHLAQLGVRRVACIPKKTSLLQQLLEVDHLHNHMHLAAQIIEPETVSDKELTRLLGVAGSMRHVSMSTNAAGEHSLRALSGSATNAEGSSVKQNVLSSAHNTHLRCIQRCRCHVIAASGYAINAVVAEHTVAVQMHDTRTWRGSLPGPYGLALTLFGVRMPDGACSFSVHASQPSMCVYTSHVHAHGQASGYSAASFVLLAGLGISLHGDRNSTAPLASSYISTAQASGPGAAASSFMGNSSTTATQPVHACTGVMVQSPADERAGAAGAPQQHLWLKVTTVQTVSVASEGHTLCVALPASLLHTCYPADLSEGYDPGMPPLDSEGLAGSNAGAAGRESSKQDCTVDIWFLDEELGGVQGVVSPTHAFTFTPTAPSCGTCPPHTRTGGVGVGVGVVGPTDIKSKHATVRIGTPSTKYVQGQVRSGTDLPAVLLIEPGNAAVTWDGLLCPTGGTAVGAGGSTEGRGQAGAASERLATAEQAPGQTTGQFTARGSVVGMHHETPLVPSGLLRWAAAVSGHGEGEDAEDSGCKQTVQGMGTATTADSGAQENTAAGHVQPSPVLPFVVQAESLPRHIAVVMDGNGRWAKQRGLPRSAGHRAGVNTIHTLIRSCRRLRVQYLTLYAFSAQNWSRPPAEVSVLMSLLEEFVATDLKELTDNGVRLRVLGDMTRLPSAARAGLEHMMEASKGNSADGLTLILALSYGGREEVATAAAAAAAAARDGLLNPEALTDPAVFRQWLPLPDVPDPDLLIRTSGELRLSNFLLWHVAYTELYVTPVLWPDFGDGELAKALTAYAARERRFGKTSEQLVGEQGGIGGKNALDGHTVSIAAAAAGGYASLAASHYGQFLSQAGWGAVPGLLVSYASLHRFLSFRVRLVLALLVCACVVSSGPALVHLAGPFALSVARWAITGHWARQPPALPCTLQDADNRSGGWIGMGATSCIGTPVPVPPGLVHVGQPVPGGSLASPGSPGGAGSGEALEGEQQGAAHGAPSSTPETAPWTDGDGGRSRRPVPADTPAALHRWRLLANAGAGASEDTAAAQWQGEQGKRIAQEEHAAANTGCEKHSCSKVSDNVDAVGDAGPSHHAVDDDLDVSSGARATQLDWTLPARMATMTPWVLPYSAEAVQEQLLSNKPGGRLRCPVGLSLSTDGRC